jgi:16S rRNA (cytidine1402-2'-O)-methyltransferase
VSDPSHTEAAPHAPSTEGQSAESGAGALIVVATPIGNLGDLSPRAVDALATANVIACEDTRHTRKLLTRAGVRQKRLLSVHEHNEAARVDEVMDVIEAGGRVALVADAGMPAISDPGRRVVAAVASRGHEVRVVPGPSAALAALVVSGLDTERFVFEGFLPRKGPERARRLSAVAVEPRTTVLYEAPHRLAGTVADLLEACGPSRRVVLARELTKVHEEVWRGTLEGAAGKVAQSDPRGEHVIVLEGAPAPPAASDDEIAAALAERLREGEEKRSALAAVSAELAVPKRRVYQVSLRVARP